METETKIERCTIDDIGMELIGKDAQPIIDTVNEYLSVFAKPIRIEKPGFASGSVDCLKCNRRLDGMLGTFKWGLAHGEGNCTECGWPARLYHYPQDESGNIFNGPLQFCLQYHPDEVTQAETGE